MWTIKPALKHTDLDLANDLSFAWSERPVYRNGNIYFSSIVQTDGEIINKRPKIYGFNLYRLPLKMNGSNIEFNGSSPKKMEYPVYPKAATSTEYVAMMYLLFLWMHEVPFLLLMEGWPKPLPLLFIPKPGILFFLKVKASTATARL